MTGETRKREREKERVKTAEIRQTSEMESDRTESKKSAEDERRSWINRLAPLENFPQTSCDYTHIYC